jgi:hypothetical protein
MRNSNNINNNSNFNPNPSNLNVNYNPNIQNIPANNEVYMNSIMRMQNIPNFSSPMRSLNENIVLNNFSNNNQRNNINQHQNMNLQGNINKNNFINNPNINMIHNYGNISQINNPQNRINPNMNNQQYVNFMSIPMIEGSNTSNISQKNFNYQMNNVKNYTNFLLSYLKIISKENLILIYFF